MMARHYGCLNQYHNGLPSFRAPTNYSMVVRRAAERLTSLSGCPWNAINILPFFGVYTLIFKRLCGEVVKLFGIVHRRTKPKNAGHFQMAKQSNLEPSSLRMIRPTGRGGPMTLRHLTSCRNSVSHNMNSFVGGTAQSTQDSASELLRQETRRLMRLATGSSSVGVRGSTKNIQTRPNQGNYAGMQRLMDMSGNSKAEIRLSIMAKRITRVVAHLYRHALKIIHFIHRTIVIALFSNHYQNHSDQCYSMEIFRQRPHLIHSKLYRPIGCARHRKDGLNEKGQTCRYLLLLLTQPWGATTI